MCETSSRAIGRPRWGWLYGATVSPLAALAVVEMLTPPNVLRTVLRYTLTLATLAGMAFWIRASRAAFDLQEWCECAAGTITVRVIESRRPVGGEWPDPLEPAPAFADAEHELVHH
jgi:hypothetical protein